MVVSKQSNITVRLKLSLSAQYANAEPVKIEANAKGKVFGRAVSTTFSIYDLSFFLTALLITIKGVFYTEIAFYE